MGSTFLATSDYTSYGTGGRTVVCSPVTWEEALGFGWRVARTVKDYWRILTEVPWEF